MQYFSWIRRLFRLCVDSFRRPHRTRRRLRLGFESLEDRLTPATHTWTGLGADANWTTPANWIANQAPNPANGVDDLIFPNAAMQPININNFRAGTTFRSITFEGNGYVISGNIVRLSGGIMSGLAGNLTGRNTFGPTIWLVGSPVFSIHSSTVVTLTGTLAGARFQKDGVGKLLLEGAPGTTFRGAVTVTGGMLELGRSGVPALNGILNISGSSVLLNANDQLGDATRVQARSGNLFLQGFSDRIASLTLIGGTASSGMGTLQLGGNVVCKASGLTSVISGRLDLGGKTRVFTVEGGAVLVCVPTISNGGLDKRGLGNMILFGNANTYAGPTVVRAGTLSVQNSAALGDVAVGTTVIGGATLHLQENVNVAEPVTFGSATQSGGTLRTGGPNTWSGPITLRRSSTFHVDGTGLLTAAGPISLGNQLLTVTGDGNTAITGALTGASRARLVKQGVGILTLTNAANSTGSTQVLGGTLRVNGLLNSLRGVTVGSGAALEGTGRIVGPVSINGGRLSPGAGAPSFLDTASVTLGAGSTFAADLNGTTAGADYDQLRVSGVVNLGGTTLNISLLFTSLVGDAFTIIDNDGSDAIVGTFNGLGEGATFTVGAASFRISYVAGTGNDVVLTQV